MNIYLDRCLELGFPAPRLYDTQESYLLRLLRAGRTINSRLCRYLGIFHLHSIEPALRKKGWQFIKEKGKAKCPFTGKVPTYPVIIIYMTKEQREQFTKRKPAKA